MNALSAERAKTARLVMNYLRTPSRLEALRRGGFPPTTPIIACEWETKVSQVLSMLRQQPPSPKVLVLIRRGEDTICTLGGSAEDGDESAVNIYSTSPDVEMGMVYTALEAPRRLSAMPSAHAPTQKLGNYDLATLVPA